MSDQQINNSFNGDIGRKCIICKKYHAEGYCSGAGTIDNWDNLKAVAEGHIVHHEYHIAQLRKFIAMGDRLNSDEPKEKSILPELLRELAEELNG